MGREWNAYSNWPHLRAGRVRRRLPVGYSTYRVYTRGRVYTIIALRYTGQWVTEVRHRFAPADGVWLIHQWERPKIVKKKSAAAAATGAKHLAPLESTYMGQLLPLIEHCGVRQYDDGDPREPGWFTVATQGAAWVITVKDPDSCCSFRAIGETLDKALELAALLLSADEAPWEPDTFLAASAARKKKK